MLAKEKSAEEHNPCAIIINIVPAIPQLDIVKVPESIRPICPTEE